MTEGRMEHWYLDIMSPNTKGEKFAWLDPTSIYINGEAFTQLLDDLTADLEGFDCDVVADMMQWDSFLAPRSRHGSAWIRRSARPANYALIRTPCPSRTIQAGRRTWKCAHRPLPPEPGFFWSINGSRQAARWMAPFDLSNGREALSPASPPSPWKTMTGPRAIAPPILLSPRFNPVQTFRNNATVRRWILHKLQAGNGLSESSLMRSVHAEQTCRSVHTGATHPQISFATIWVGISWAGC